MKRMMMTLAVCCGLTAIMAQNKQAGNETSIKKTGDEMSGMTYQVPVSEQHEQMLTGRYEPTWQSLETHQTPEWFRDAKFGIWAHWGPQCVEGSGDWMARGMYIEGNKQYKYHLEHYGHPSEFGFKDILPLFKAEKWDPEALVERYKRCGAKYFFVLGNHHDNYDLWDSKYQLWNSKNIGPKRDILDVGDFAYGVPEWDLGMMYYSANFLSAERADNIFHLDTDTLKAHWAAFAKTYYGTDSQDVLDAEIQKLQPFIFVKMAYFVSKLCDGKRPLHEIIIQYLDKALPK